MLNYKPGIRRVARRLGYEIHSADHAHHARRARAMQVRNVDLVLDVGANIGQYANTLRDGGFRGKVVSYEPLPSAFARLAKAHGHDRRWIGRPVALGAVSGLSVLNVAESDDLSSILKSTPVLDEHFSGARLANRVEVPMVTLDEEWSTAVGRCKSVMLKIDTQGYENAVLDGAANNLKEVVLLEVEAGLVPLYEGGSYLDDLLPRLREAGFQVVSIECGGGYVDPKSGQVLDVNVLAGRKIADPCGR